MIFSIYMLIKYMLSLELNSKLEYKGLTMGKVKGFENSSHIGIILKDSSESYDFCYEASSYRGLIQLGNITWKQYQVGNTISHLETSPFQNDVSKLSPH